jgi:hypothetical protein
MYLPAMESVRRVLWIVPLLLVAISCEYGWTDNIGVSRERGGRLVANVFSCAADETIRLSVILDSDPLPDTPGEKTVWRISGRTSAPGLFQAVIGLTPPGFREEVPLVESLQPTATYALRLSWDRFDMGMSFVPSKIPSNGIQSGGELLSASEFKEIGKDSYSCDR